MEINDCNACLAKESEIVFLRGMVRTLTDKQATLMTDTLVPKVQPQGYLSPMLINEQGKIEKLDSPEEIKEETLTEIDIVNHIVGH